MAVVGTAVIDVIANTAKFESAMERAAGRAGQFSGMLQGLVRTAGALGFGAAVKTSISFADSVGDIAKQVGLSTDAFQELSYAAKQLEVDQNVLTSALTRFRDRLGEARRGSKEAAADFQALGLDPTQFRSTDEAFAAVTQRLGTMRDEFARTAVQTNLFGREAGPKLSELVAGTTGELARLREEAHRMGAVLSEETIAKADEAQKKMDVLASVIQVQLTSAFVELAPAITRATQALADFVAAPTTGEELKAYHTELNRLLSLREALEQGQLGGDLLQIEFGTRDADAALSQLNQRIRGQMDLMAQTRKLAEQAPASKPSGSGGTAPSGPPVSDADLAKQAEELQRQADESSRAVVETEMNMIAIRAEEQASFDQMIQNVLDYEDGINATVEAQEKLKQSGLSLFADQAARNIQTITANLLAGKAAGDDFFEGMLNGLRDIAAELAAQQLLTALFNAVGGAFGVTGLGTTLFGKREHGGPVVPGGMYEVNETGVPEVLSSGGKDYLMMGGQSGRVTPLSPAKGGGKNIKIVYQIDASGGTQAAQVRDLLVGLEANNRQLKAQLDEATRRGH